jgi:hypothetical protein
MAVAATILSVYSLEYLVVVAIRDCFCRRH